MDFDATRRRQAETAATDRPAPEAATPATDPQSRRQQNRSLALMLAALGAVMLLCSVGVAVLVLHVEAIHAAAAG